MVILSEQQLSSVKRHLAINTHLPCHGGRWTHRAFAKFSRGFSPNGSPSLFTTPSLRSYLLRNLVSQFPGKAITFADKLARSLEQSGSGGQ